MSRVVVNEIQAKVGNDISFNDAAKIDTLKGKTTAGSISVEITEGSTTTNLQQGLAKVVANISLSGSSNSDAALNVSSVSDGGTGLNTLNITNAFTGAKAAVPNMTNHDDSYNRGTAVDDTGTSAFILRIFQASSGSLSDTQTDQAVTIHGDLA